jgi:hypothetical protein
LNVGSFVCSVAFTKTSFNGQIPVGRLRAKFYKNAKIFNDTVQNALPWRHEQTSIDDKEDPQGAQFDRLMGRLRRLLAVSKGRELPGVANMEVIRDVMKDVVEEWEDAAKVFVQEMGQDIVAFIESILTKPNIFDERVSKAVWDALKDVVEEQCNEAIMDVQRACFLEKMMGTLNDYFHETMEAKREQRSQARMKVALEGTVTVLKDWKYDVDFGKLTQQLADTNRDQEFEIMNMADIVEAYRKTAMRRFVDCMTYYVMEGRLFMDALKRLEAAIINVPIQQLHENPLIVAQRGNAKKSFESLKNCRDRLSKFKQSGGF